MHWAVKKANTLKIEESLKTLKVIVFRHMTQFILPILVIYPKILSLGSRKFAKPELIRKKREKKRLHCLHYFCHLLEAQ